MKLRRWDCDVWALGFNLFGDALLQGLKLALSGCSFVRAEACTVHDYGLVGAY
jgi:hypothetical protein